MSSLSTDAIIGRLVTERPGRARVFERFGIDYCCGGNAALGQACAGKGLDPEAVLQELETCDAEAGAEDRLGWSEASMSELADHVMEVHHGYLREALPRLASLVNKVANVHGERHPELLQLRAVFRIFRSSLESHMAKEEQVLFPLCSQLESAESRPEFHCGSVQKPIAVMVREHDEAGSDLEVMRLLTGGYAPPEDACNTYRVMLDGLVELEENMHRHVHKENHILFPKAIAAEAAL